MNSSEGGTRASDKVDARLLRIRRLNDSFRQTLTGGRSMITSGVEALGSMAISRILYRVRTFEAFNTTNNPFDEHDFGSFRFEGRTMLWKIDYYALDLIHGSEDPADPLVTARVITIMLSSEY